MSKSPSQSPVHDFLRSELWNGCFSDGNLWNSLVHSWCCCTSCHAVPALSLQEIRMMFGFTVPVSGLISWSECLGFLAKFAMGWRVFLLDSIYSLQYCVFVEVLSSVKVQKGHQFLNFWSVFKFMPYVPSLKKQLQLYFSISLLHSVWVLFLRRWSNQKKSNTLNCLLKEV